MAQSCCFILWEQKIVDVFLCHRYKRSKMSFCSISIGFKRTKIKDRVSKIAEFGGKIQYSGMNHNGFKRNLIMVDSSMPEIIGNMLLYFNTEDVKVCDKLVDMYVLKELSFRFMD